MSDQEELIPASRLVAAQQEHERVVAQLGRQLEVRGSELANAREQRDRYKVAYDERHDEWCYVSNQVATLTAQLAEEQTTSQARLEQLQRIARVIGVEGSLVVAEQVERRFADLTAQLQAKEAELEEARRQLLELAKLTAEPFMSRDYDGGKAAKLARGVLAALPIDAEDERIVDEMMRRRPVHTSPFPQVALPVGDGVTDDTAAVRAHGIQPPPSPQVAQASEPVFSVVEGSLPGELPSSRYSAETIAYASACDLLRVTKDGLGYIRGVKPDYPEPAPTEAISHLQFAPDYVTRAELSAMFWHASRNCDGPSSSLLRHLGAMTDEGTFREGGQANGG